MIIFIDKPRTVCPCFIVALSIDKLHNRILVDFKPFMYKNLRWSQMVFHPLFQGKRSLPSFDSNHYRLFQITEGGSH